MNWPDFCLDIRSRQPETTLACIHRLTLNRIKCFKSSKQYLNVIKQARRKYGKGTKHQVLRFSDLSCAFRLFRYLIEVIICLREEHYLHCWYREA